MVLPPDRDKKGTSDDAARVEQPLIYDVEAERNLWHTFREIYNGKGTDLEQVLAAWTARQIQGLPPGAVGFFGDLCEEGCHPLVLAAIITLIRYHQSVEALWAVVVGPPESREAVTRALEEAATAIHRTFGIAAADETSGPEFDKVGRISPARLASELRLYGRTINLAGSLAAEVGVRSLEHISMLILASYVEKATTAANHKNVSGLISEIRPEPYTEDAQKQWRYRNKDMLDNPSAVSRITDFLLAISQVLPRGT